MPHHLQKSGLLERAAQTTAATGTRSSDRAAPSQRHPRLGQPAWPGKRIPLGTARHQITPQRSHQTGRGSPHTQPAAHSTYPVGAATRGPSNTSSLIQAHQHKPTSPGLPELCSCIPLHCLGPSLCYSPSPRLALVLCR